MKKILVVTTKFPFPLFSGDKLRIYNISKYLSKKNKVDLIYTGPKENFKKKNQIYWQDYIYKNTQNRKIL